VNKTAQNSLSKFRFAIFRFFFVPQERVVLPPYKGSIFRGCMGKFLRQATCVMSKKICKECQGISSCVYYQVFETPIPKESEYFQGQSFAPHPFVLEPPEPSSTHWNPYTGSEYYRPGDQLTFNLILVGRAIGHLPFFIHAFDKLGKAGIGQKIAGRRGKCLLEKVESINPLRNEVSQVIYTHTSQELLRKHTVLKASDLLSYSFSTYGQIELEFLTPTQIKSDGKIQLTLDFEVLIRCLLRRLLALSYFHCGAALELDYLELCERAKQVKVLSNNLTWQSGLRYSHRLKRALSLGGFAGTISFEGKMTEFLPFIQLGEYLHIGKGTAFGLGKYRIKNGVSK
jgi:hypothetical protein